MKLLGDDDFVNHADFKASITTPLKNETLIILPAQTKSMTKTELDN
jgi:hypothetical protein